MRLLDSRRLFGPNVQTDGPGAIAEVGFDEGEDEEAAIAAWRRAVHALVPDAPLTVRRWRRGAALVISGEPDQALALTEVNDHAVAGTSTPAELSAMLSAAIDPPLRALIAEAGRRGLPALLDDAALSIGLGRRSRVWERTALPPVGDVPWAELGRVPVGMVTGTNGKTTTTRLAGRMAAKAGLVAGVAVTGGLLVRGEVLHEGDYTGPEAARLVLRHPDVELAILETARGGILRRGLALDRCDAGVVTNVSDDHIGLYGVDDVATMAAVKAVVARSARVAVLNAGDPELRALGASLPQVVWFGPGGDWQLAAGWIVRRGERLVPVADVPIAFGGAAQYNVENALAASALAEALGVPDAAIVEALRTFSSDAEDNPGRGNWHDARGVSVLLDFAHNPEGVRAVLAMVAPRRSPAARLCVIVSQPGDRRDDAIVAVAREIAAARPERVIVHEMSGYLRGREPGVVPALLVGELARAGVSSVKEAADAPAALAQALAGAREGDVVVIMPALDAEALRAIIAAP